MKLSLVLAVGWASVGWAKIGQAADERSAVSTPADQGPSQQPSAAIEPAGNAAPELTLGIELPAADGFGDLQLNESTGQIQIDGQPVAYRATAGTLPLTDNAGKTTANIFFVAYHRVLDRPDAPRPLTFCFNGGPGSSSVWLHLGMLGPRKVRMNSEARPERPPFALQDNADSLLDVTDLVFIDPVSTGYSRSVGEAKPEQFHGYDEDLESVGEFIRLYTTRFDRWDSPLFLMGESYGCMRAAGLSSLLQSKHGIELNGITLVSSVINFQTIRFGVGNDLPYVLFLPSYSATAWYHGRLSPEYQRRPVSDIVAEAREFALGDYAAALLQGSRLNGRQRREIALRISQLTGLSARYVQQADLRISMARFAKELDRSRGRTIGRLDSRFLGVDRDAVGDRYEFDASYAAILGPYTSAMHQYLRRELQVERDEPYEILTSKVQPWSYANFENRYVDSSESLRQAMTRNPHLKVFVANGYYDLATPFLASEYSFSHLGLPRALQANVRMGYYEAGHMMYIHEPSLKQLRADLLKFYRSAIRTPEPHVAD